VSHVRCAINFAALEGILSLFETIIGIAERSWREKPRKDTVKAIVSLRNAMVECQKAWEEYRTTPSEDRQLSILRWRRSVFQLGETLEKVNPVLEVFDPEVARSVSLYYDFEGRPGGQDPPKAVNVEVLGEALGEASDVRLKFPILTKEFTDALTKLDSFIKANFKIEEVYSSSIQQSS